MRLSTRLALIMTGVALVGAVSVLVWLESARVSAESQRDLPRAVDTVPPEWFGHAEATRLAYWRSKPLPARLADLPLTPSANAATREAAARLKAGEFRPYRHYEWLPIGVPPPWDENPVGSGTWDLWRHSLRWIRPLVSVWYADGDRESLRLIQEIVRDWRDHNEDPPGASTYAWKDHPCATRLQNLCWLWELYRTSEAPEEDFALLLLELIHQHAEFTADDENYTAHSNHGLMQNVALLQAAVLYPEFRAADEWRSVVDRRMIAYMKENFSAEGFHLEQAPAYHAFVLSRIGAILRFLRVNDQPPMPEVDAAARRVAAVLPYLLRPDGHFAGVGDSWDVKPRDYRQSWRQWWGADIPTAAASTAPNPRQEAGEFMLSFDAGYAIFTAYAIEASEPDPDTYVFFKCNAFPYAHNHVDALTFILYGMGRDWLIDSGVHSHNKVPERWYVRGARAHSLVLVDEADFDLGSVELVGSGRTVEGDFVCARHHLPQATHTRTLTFKPPYQVEILDELAATDGRPHTYSQLFHVSPALEPRIISDRRVELVGDDGKMCVIEQSGASGGWRIITGQTEPYWQGWFSPGFDQIEPAPALYYSCREPQTDARFVTTIRLVPAMP